MNLTAIDLISHPQILRAAWRRVRHWYAYGDQPPEPIYSSWLADEDGWLQALSEHIKSGASQYLHLPLIPYPKQGAAVRHFCRPAVEVQVYFTAIAVLLAPWLEQCMPPCSFANRWYRGLYRNKASNGKSVWQNRPFVLEDRYAYQPYPRAYGLFRRVAHWTSQAMVGEAPSNANALTGSKAAIPDDYAEGYLPDFVRNEWWEKQSDSGSNASTRGYWAEIDLQLAYPSVKISVLRACLMDMVAEENPSAQQEPQIDYPKYDITNQLQELKTRQALVTILCDALEKVTYDTKDAPGNLWLPPDIKRPMPRDSGKGHPGLPTGLVISGLLLNAYLKPVDKAMMRWCNGGKCGGKGAFLRFADDMRIMARSPETLFEGMDELWSAICSIREEATEPNTAPAGFRTAYFSRPDASNQSNLRINLTKLGPKPVRNIAEAYLRADGWTKKDENGQLQPPNKPLADSAPHRLLDWWNTRSDDDRKPLTDAIQREALTAGNLNAFVTHLVERMSELGGETLQERFGAEARQRLTDLHQLVRFEIDDKQVKKATRLSFGTGKLARAWLPEADENEDRKLITEIRESVGMALRQAPWKTSLWRSVLRAAVRRPCGETAQNRENDKRNADEWLKKQLELIQHRGRVRKKKSGHDLAWHSIWPEEVETPAKCDDEKNRNDVKDEKRKLLSLSAHRAAFWFALRDTITDLDRAITATAKRQAEPLPERHREWASQEWTFRALPQEELQPARTWLARLEVWCDMLYPAGSSSHVTTTALQECSLYEIEALSLAVLRCEEPFKLLNYQPQRHNPSNKATAAESSYEHIVIGWARWAIACSHPDDDKLRAWAARLLPGKSVPIRQCPHHNLGRPLLPFGLLQTIPLRQRSATLSDWLEPNAPNSHKNVIERLRQFQMQRCFPESVHQTLSRRTQDRFTALQGIIDAPSKKKPENLWFLREYAWARRALLGINDSGVASRNDAGHFSLHRLLWSSPWRKLPDAASHWTIEPASVAAIGLPLRIACRLLEHSLRMQCKTTWTTLGNPPVWLFKGSGEGSPGFWLAAGRQCQFEEEKWESFESLSVPPAHPLPSTRSGLWLQCMEPEERRGAWEVLPHPLYLMPGVLPSDMTPEAYDRWCHILQFLTAVRGDEQMLDTLFEWGTGGVPFDDRWNWRHHVHMPQDFWQDFEQLSRVALGRRVRHTKPINRPIPEHDNLLLKLHDINAAQARPLDFRWERVDIQLSEKDPWDLPIAVLPYGRNAQATSDTDGQAEMHEQKHDKLFKVRMGQISNEPDWKTIVRRGMQLNRNEIQSIMSQVGAVFLHESGKFKTDNGEERCEGMIVLPEVTIPNTERKTILDWAKERRHAVLAGCLWRPLATAMQPHMAIQTERVHLVNEAVLALPLADGGNEKWAPVRQFTLRKPIPAPMEQGLGRALSQNDVPGRTWHMLAGSRWYRFVHQRWGSFSVAICADLIDPAPWNTMRGLIQHLITCAYNQDVDLYEAMTWVRAYENFTNVVLVNHGKYGGSFVWTPRHSQGKELIRLRGKNLNLVADVELPVEDLISAQRDGLEYAIRKAEKYWLGEQTESGKKNDVLKDFKSPPPGYRNQNK